MGLPIVAALAWSYEITPGGIVPDEDRPGGVHMPRARRAVAPALVAGLVNDASAAVRREAVIALRFEKAEAMAPLWAQLAPGGDRLAGHLQILASVCNALHFAHSRGVLHREVAV